MAQVLTASWSAILPTGAVRVGISRGTPRRGGGYRRVRALEPGPWFRTVTPARYLDLYREILDRLDPAEIHDQLLSYGDCPVLLCWESLRAAYAFVSELGDDLMTQPIYGMAIPR